MTKTLILQRLTDSTIAAEFPFDQSFNEVLKAFGGRWEDRKWKLPTIAAEPLATIAANTAAFTDTQYRGFIPAAPTLSESLFPYQKANVLRALCHNFFFFIWDTSTGKTVVAAELMRLKAAKRILIVSPATPRYMWKKALPEWYPAAPPVTVVDPELTRTTGGDWDTWRQSIVAADSYAILCSYNMINKVAEIPFDFIVMDEAHRLMDHRSRRSSLMKDIVRDNPAAYRLMLSATPMPDDVIDIYSPLDILTNGKFGTHWSFGNKYCNVVRNEYGTSFIGCNEETESDLKKRVGYFSSRITKEMAAAYMPKVNLSLHLIDPPEVPLDWGSPASIKSYFETANDRRTVPALQRSRELLQSGDLLKLCIFTHRIATAEKIAETLRAEHSDVDVQLITGGVAQQKRLQLIDESSTHPRSVIVATMHSCGEGLNNLNPYTKVIFAELYWSFGVIDQAIGRFARIGGTENVDIEFFLAKGSLEEKMIAKLARSIPNIGSIIGANSLQENLIKTLAGDSRSDDDLLTELGELAGFLSDDDQNLMMMGEGDE